MSNNSIEGKVFDGRVIDRVVELESGLMEIGFTDNTFERIHPDDFDGFVGSLEDAPEVSEEAPELEEAPQINDEQVPVVDEVTPSDSETPETAPESEGVGLGQRVAGFFGGNNTNDNQI